MYGVSYQYYCLVCQDMGDTTGLSNAEAKELCAEPDSATKVSNMYSISTNCSHGV